jgi:hypothetical protein
MRWEERFIGARELDEYLDGNTSGLGHLAKALIRHQKDTWPMLAEGYRALAAVETKRFQLRESVVLAQHNAGRRRSTSAKVDRASVEARKCFLCPDELPVEEKGIPYGDLVILCNPFPVLDSHLSIVHRLHTEQKIYGNVESLLALARDLGQEFFVLYNGPQCGASAPDHLHFQACSSQLLPIQDDLGSDGSMESQQCAVCSEGRDDFELFTLSDLARSVVVFRGNNLLTLAQWIYDAIAGLSGGSETEPMINIVATHAASTWTVYLFPRARHRPACFFAEGEDRLMISPGAIDMAGVVVVPERAHFERLTAQKLEDIFAEVSLGVEEVDSVIERLSASQMGEGPF